MNVTVILVGLGVLVALGALIGAANGRAQSQAWRNVADARYANWADRQRQFAEQQARDEEYSRARAPRCDVRLQSLPSTPRPG